MFSRKTDVSSTRIDYVFSNTKSCVYFQYLPVQGLDLSIALAKYEISLEFEREKIPRERYFDGWVISSYLEKDEEFLEQAKYIIDTVYIESEKELQYPSFYWLKVKTSLIELAKSREKEVSRAKSEKMKILRGFYSSIFKDIQRGYD